MKKMKKTKNTDTWTAKWVPDGHFFQFKKSVSAKDNLSDTCGEPHLWAHPSVVTACLETANHQRY